MVMDCSEEETISSSFTLSTESNYLEEEEHCGESGGEEDSGEESGGDDGDQNEKALWRGVSQVFTCCFCERFVPGKTRESRQAWREKVTLNCLIYIFSLIFVFILGVLPLIICPSGQIYTWRDVWAQRNAQWVIVHGDIIDVEEYFSDHPGGSAILADYLGRDASMFFTRPSPTTLPSKCLNPNSVHIQSFTNETKSCASQNIFENINLKIRYCHSTDYLVVVNKLKTGELAYTFSDLKDTPGEWITIFNRIYNITNYINKNYEYLDPPLHELVINKKNEDGTDIYKELYPNNSTIECLESQFYSGVIDTRFSLQCYIINILILISVGIVAAVMILKFLVSIVSLGEKEYTLRNKKYVIINIPCYTEDEESLTKTLRSIASMEYNPSQVFMIIVADGMIKGKGQEKRTPEVLLQILGRSIGDETKTYIYDSLGIGDKSKNIAKIFSGMYTHKTEEQEVKIPYMVIVKIGFGAEALFKPGNRGKRDSQLILFKFLGKVFRKTELNEMESAMKESMLKINGGVPLEKYEFMMTVDSDTRTDPGSLKAMVATMCSNKKVVALCGETRVDNKWDSWVSAIQVYEYYINHHLHKAFESLFGSVTCLPGCFSMYRLYFLKNEPGLLHKDIIKEYSNNTVNTLHKRNLYELGEDRYLTSLLLKYFPNKKLIFITNAVCHTVVPNTWPILKSQRRRWINSTIHNLLELVRLTQLRGVCCFSMKFIVALDIVSSFSLPASVLYLVYLIYLFITETSVISSLIIFVFVVIYLTQLLLFLFKREYSYILWMILYIFSIPLWYFILPIISWWRMDDFQWGQTRKVEQVELSSFRKIDERRMTL